MTRPHRSARERARLVEGLRSVARRLSTVRYGERASVIDEAAALMSVSRQECYRRLRWVGWTTARKQRRDAGTSALQPHELEAIATLLQPASRCDATRLRGLRAAIGAAQRSDLLRTQLSASQIGRLLRAHGYTSSTEPSF